MLDTTLRDGDQTPHVHFKPEDKLLIARKLDELGVDVVEAGTAVASEGERKAVKAIAGEGLNAKVFSFSRVLKQDLDAALECNVDGVHLVFPSSDLHIKTKLKKDSRQEAVPIILEALDYAKNHGLAVELSAEDGSRASKEFLAEVFSKARKADRVCVCDTVGVLTPEKTSELFSFLVKKVKKPLAFHGHNDLGLATANTLAAVYAGASEFHATLNGLGERAGNAALEEVCTALKLFYGVNTVELKKLYEASQLVSALSNLPVASNKPVVGENAFVHESGIHVDGILKDPETYEGLTPGLVGRERKIVLGKMSGRKSVEFKLREFGIQVDRGELEKIFSEVKSFGDKGKACSDADLIAIANQVHANGKVVEKVKVEDLRCTTGSNVTPSAVVRLRVLENGVERVVGGRGKGDGPVDAAVKAVENALGLRGKRDVRLEEYHVDAVTGGTEALVRVNVVMKRGGKRISSAAVGSDIVMASVDAILKALNVLL